MKDPKTILTFFFAGQAVFTLRSVKTGEHFTYRIMEAPKRKETDHPVFFVSLLTGPDNTKNFTYMGMIRHQRVFLLTEKSRCTKDTPSVIAFEWSFKALLQGKVPAMLEVWHEGRCARCAAVLTDAISIATGFGPTCSEKVGILRAELPLAPKISKKLAKTELRAKAEPVSLHSAAEIEQMIEQQKHEARDVYYQEFQSVGMTEKAIHDFWFRRFSTMPLENFKRSA